MSSNSSPDELPPASEPLSDIPGGWTETRVDLGVRVFQLRLPARPDDFLDDPDVLRANRESDYMPYWAWLWPAAQVMSRQILAHPWQAGTPAIELGCGIGLAGLAGLAAGLRVTFSDYDPVATRLAAENAARNGFPDSGSQVLDWNRPETLPESHFPVVLGCDVTYERPLHEPLLRTLDRILTPDGCCWLADPGRHTLPHFLAAAQRNGWRVHVHDSAVPPRMLMSETDSGVQAEYRLVLLYR